MSGGDISGGFLSGGLLSGGLLFSGLLFGIRTDNSLEVSHLSVRIHVMCL